jgi:hypothetical protein
MVRIVAVIFEKRCFLYAHSQKANNKRPKLHFTIMSKSSRGKKPKVVRTLTLI